MARLAAPGSRRGVWRRWAEVESPGPLRRWGAALAALLVALFLGIGCQSPAPQSPPAAPAKSAGAPSAGAPAQPATSAPAPAASPTPSRPLPLRLAYAARNGSQALAQVLVDSGVLAENGLEPSLLYVDGPPRAIAALLAGDVDVMFMGGEPALRAAVEGAPLVVIAGVVNRREHVLFANPEIQTLADLRGKRVAINGIQSADHQAVVDALRYAGVDPREVSFLVVGGGQPNRVTAMQTGAVDASGLQPPLTARARALGLRELVAIGQLVDRPVPNTAVVSSRTVVSERPELLRRFARALVQGIALYESQPEVVVRALAAFYSVDPAESRAEMDDTRVHYAALYPAVPYPPHEGYRLLLEEIAETNPRARDFPLADAVDDSFVRAVDPSAGSGATGTR